MQEAELLAIRQAYAEPDGRQWQAEEDLSLRQQMQAQRFSHGERCRKVEGHAEVWRHDQRSVALQRTCSECALVISDT